LSKEHIACCFLDGYCSNIKYTGKLLTYNQPKQCQGNDHVKVLYIKIGREDLSSEGWELWQKHTGKRHVKSDIGWRMKGIPSESVLKDKKNAHVLCMNLFV